MRSVTLRFVFACSAHFLAHAQDFVEKHDDHMIDTKESVSSLVTDMVSSVVDALVGNLFERAVKVRSLRCSDGLIGARQSGDTILRSGKECHARPPLDGGNSAMQVRALRHNVPYRRGQKSSPFAAAFLSLAMLLCPPALCHLNAAYAAPRPEQLGTTADVGLSADAWRKIVDKDANLGNAVTRVATKALFGLSDSPGREISDEERLKARNLVKEVWSIIDEQFLDARNAGFDRKKWASLLEGAYANLDNGGMPRAYNVVRWMLSNGVEDPYTYFIDPQQIKERFVNAYDVSGVGLNIASQKELPPQSEFPPQRVDGSLRVVGLIPGSEGENAGIQQGDEIIEVDGQSVIGKDAFEVATLMQGGPSDSIDKVEMPPAAITVVRAADGDKQFVKLPRKRIADQPVLETRLQKDGVSGGSVRTGYVRLSKFDKAALRELRPALEKLSAAGSERFVLDLRDNAGGLLPEAVEIAKLFLDPGEMVVETVTAKRDTTPTQVPTSPAARQYRVDSSPLYARERAPLVVLVNGRTASAAEILTGALQDNCRAVVVGEGTFGKGLIQNVYGFSDGSGLMTTTGKYRLPSGRDLDRIGIKPDFVDTPNPAQVKATLSACEVKRQSRDS